MEKGKLLKVYVGEKQRYQNKSLFQYLVHWLNEKGIRGVTVKRGIEGYGKDRVIHSTKLLELASDLPIVLEIADSVDVIDALLPDICKIVPKGLVFTVDIEIHK
jgi:PII-like signaling protein